MKKWYIKKEKMGGEWYYMIYRKRWLLKDLFFERWNTSESAKVRLRELHEVQGWTQKNGKEST